MAKSAKYRAIQKIEWPDYENADEEGRPGTVVVRPGEEFADPPEHANIAELVAHDSVEEI